MTEKQQVKWRERIEKALITNDFLNGGRLDPVRQQRFENLIRGTNDMMSNADLRFVDRLRVTVDEEHFGRHVLRAGVGEATAPGIPADLRKPAFNRRAANLQKVSGFMNVSFEALVENIDQPDYDAKLVDRFMQKAANDISYVAVNGNTGSGDPLLSALDGFYPLSDNAYVYDAEGAVISKRLFHGAFRALPKEVRRRKDQLKFVANTLLQDNWVDVYGDRATVGGDAATRGEVVSPNGIRFMTCDEIDSDISVGYTAATYGKHVGTVYDLFTFTAANNIFRLQVTVAGVVGANITLTIPVGAYTAPELAAELNAQMVTAGEPEVFYAVDGRLYVRTVNTGVNDAVLLIANANSAYATLGMTVANYPGAAAAAGGAINNGTYMWLTMPENFRVYLLDNVRTSWGYQPRSDMYEFTLHYYLAPHIVDYASMVRVDNVRLIDYQ